MLNIMSLVAIKEIKTSVIYHQTQERLKLKKPIITSTDNDGKLLERPCITGGSIKQYTCFERQISSFLES